MFLVLFNLCFSAFHQNDDNDDIAVKIKISFKKRIISVFFNLHFIELNNFTCHTLQRFFSSSVFELQKMEDKF
jgi:hypothetical protein